MALRVCVIGAGIIGASIAYFMTRRGAEITVIDPASRERMATLGSLAWINSHLSGSDAYFRLRLRSMRLWHGLISELPGVPIRLSGTLNWEDRRGEMTEVAAEHQRLGARTRIVEAPEINQLVPGLSPPDRALWSPDEGVADPDRIAHAFLSAAVAGGATVRHGALVEAIDPKGNSVRFDDGSNLDVDRIVVAAGLGSVPLLKALDIDLPLAPSPGMLIRTNSQPPLARPFLAAPDAHFWQMGDGRIIAGADYAGTHDADGVDEIAAGLIDALERLFPGTSMVEEERRITQRPMPEDGFPILGGLPSHPRISVAVTHSGVTLAPVIGEMIAADVLGNGDPDLGRYSLMRFA
ncbi:MAG: FAD-dependent oxidoreductase [Pseudomonadota bacterium]